MGEIRFEKDRKIHFTHNDGDAVLSCFVLDFYMFHKNYDPEESDINNMFRWYEGKIKHNFLSAARAKEEVKRWLDIAYRVLDDDQTLALPDLDYFVDRCNYSYDENPEVISPFGLTLYSLPSGIYMSDISIDAKTIELANNIKTLVKEKYDYDIELLYVDHHATTTEFDRMADWVHSSPTDKTETSGVLRSACYQLYNILFKDTYGSIEEQKPYDKTVKWTMLPFVNIGLVNLLRDVSAYDTGREWRNNPEIYKVNRFRERYVALLSYGLGGDGVTGPARLYNNLNKCWFKYLILGLIHPDTPLRDIDKIGDIIKIQEDQIETSRQLAIRNYVQVEGQDIGLAGIYAHANIAIMVLNHGDVISETMEAVCQHQRRNHVNDIVIGIQVPYRTIQLRRGSEKYDLSVLAKDLGGGGHPAASGFRCSTQYLMMLLTTYFNEWDRTNFA